MHCRNFILKLLFFQFYCFITATWTPEYVNAQILTKPIDGANLYQKLCSECHGPKGIPEKLVAEMMETSPTNLAYGPYKYGEGLEDIEESISLGRGSSMFRYDKRLTRAQINAIAQAILLIRKEARFNNSRTSKK